MNVSRRGFLKISGAVAAVKRARHKPEADSRTRSAAENQIR